MYALVNFVHSYWAYLVLVMLVITTFNSIIGFVSDREYSARDMRLALFTLITMHIQLLIGIVLWIVSPSGIGAIQDHGMGGIMKQDGLRKLAIEHPTLMIIAVIFVTIGYSKHKKKLVSKPKLKMLAIFYTLALIAVLAIIPWGQWF